MVMQNMRCPGCGEETFEDELIAGKCPLCGAKIKEPSEQVSGGSSSDPFITCVPDYDEMPFDMANSSVVDRMYDLFGDMFTGAGTFAADQPHRV